MPKVKAKGIASNRNQ